MSAWDGLTPDEYAEDMEIAARAYVDWVSDGLCRLEREANEAAS